MDVNVYVVALQGAVDSLDTQVGEDGRAPGRGSGPELALADAFREA